MESMVFSTAPNRARRVSDADRKVAITFDDGPDDRWTPAVLDVLGTHDVRATFFCLGTQVEQHPSVLRLMADLGHDIANHTWDHPYLTQLTAQEVEHQCARTDAAIHAVIAKRPRLFRPPYLDINDGVRDVLTDMHYRIVPVDADSRDWAGISASEIRDNIVSSVRPGSILLFHCGTGDYQNTVNALPGIIGALRDDGYSFVPVSELIGEPAYR